MYNNKLHSNSYHGDKMIHDLAEVINIIMFQIYEMPIEKNKNTRQQGTVLYCYGEELNNSFTLMKVETFIKS